MRVVAAVLSLSVGLLGLAAWCVEMGFVDRELATGIIAEPATPSRWCSLAETLEAQGNREQADHCAERALKLGSAVPAILMRVANLRFGREEYAAGMDLTSRILNTVPNYDAIIFSYYRRYGIPVSDIMASGLPSDDRAWHAYFRNLLSWAGTDAAELVWTRVSAEHGRTDELAGAYVRYLVAKSRYKDAAMAWAEYLGDRRGGYQLSEFTYNPGFELDATATMLEWQIRLADGVHVERAEEPYHGTYAMRFSFDGTHNMAYRHLEQTTYLPPGAYRLTAMVRTAHLSTDKGLYFRVFDPITPSRLDERTTVLARTHDWTPLEAAFTVRKPTELVRVQLCRDESLRIDSKIRGEAWIDDVSITPAR